jgi:glycosyl transferase family 25
VLFHTNRDGAGERRDAMASQLAALGLSYTRIGVDFRGWNDAAIDAWLAPRFPGIAFEHASVSSAEIGCWSSHLTAWRALADSEAEACTVLEDDLVLDARLPAAISTLASRPLRDLVFLGTSCRNVSTRHRTEIDDGFALHRPLGTIYNTWGYVVSRDWVRRFFAATPWRIDRPIDHYTGGRRARSAKPRAAVLRPAVVHEHPALGPVSQIEPYTYRIDRAKLVELARRRIIASRVSALYYRLYRLL